MDRGEIVLYQPDNTVTVEVRLTNNDVWLNRKQIATLFGLAEMEDEDVLMEHVLSVSIIGNESDAGWSEIDFFGEYMFYFKYLGYDGEKKQHIGKYEYHELFDPWE